MPRKNPASKVYLVDASIYIFRAWFSIDDRMRSPAGVPINAVYGFAHFLTQLLRKTQPVYIAACFDASLTSSFRNRLYPAYKANREPAPPELKHQFELCRRLARAYGIPVFSSKRYEADDLIATLAYKAREQQNRNVIVSRDKDLLQVLRSGDKFWNFADDEEVGYQGVRQVKGVRAEQIADLLALSGDAVDNIPGIKGIGSKTAVALLQRFRSIDHMYENVDKILQLDIRGSKRIHSQLLSDRKLLETFRQLTQLRFDIPMKATMAQLEWSGINNRSATRLFNELGFGARLKSQLERLAEIT